MTSYAHIETAAVSRSLTYFRVLDLRPVRVTGRRSPPFWLHVVLGTLCLRHGAHRRTKEGHVKVGHGDWGPGDWPWLPWLGFGLVDRPPAFAIICEAPHHRIVRVLYALECRRARARVHVGMVLQGCARIGHRARGRVRRLSHQDLAWRRDAPRERNARRTQSCVAPR